MKTDLKKLHPPFPAPFTRENKKDRTALIPNLSRSFSRIGVAAFRREGYRAELLPVANEQAKKYGKQYVHNDICYPAQINIGEALFVLKEGLYQPDQVAFAVAKNCEDCRAGQYAALARKALDDAGFKMVPIVTTGEDTKGMHPGFRIGFVFSWVMLWGMAVTDALEEMVLKTRPYELEPGLSDTLFQEYLDKIGRALEGKTDVLKVLAEAVEAFNRVPVERKERRPRVFVIGEILMNYHTTANCELVRYLEKNHIEVILPQIITFFHRAAVAVKDGLKRNFIRRPLMENLVASASDLAYRYATGKVARIMEGFRFYEGPSNIDELMDNIDGFVDKSLVVGEGWLIPAEIIHYARQDVDNFIILQPFGCLPNQITGRGLTKSLKRLFPKIQILCLDYDYDVSLANIENRLQMLIMRTRETHLCDI